MRIVLILLLLANLALFALTRLDSFSGGEGQRLGEQVQPDKIKLLTAQQVAALGPAKAAALADVCVEWGPFGEADRARALADLAPLALGTLLTQRRLEGEATFAVTLPAMADRATAERRVAELRARGITDLAVVDMGRGQFTVSLGVFRTEQGANARAAAVAQQGVANARVVPRSPTAAQTTLVIRDPSQPAVTRLRELVGSYPGTEVKVGPCERG
jgi:hypothetical protein